MLNQTSGGAPPMLGRRVIVYGGGNTADGRRPHRETAGPRPKR